MNDTLYPENPILLVDDEENFLLSANFILNTAGISNIIECADGREVERIMREHAVSVVVLDIVMPFIKGTEVLRFLSENYPKIPVIMSTALNDVNIAVDAMKNGAFDYLVKPIDDTRLISTLKRAVQFIEVHDQNAILKSYLLSDKLEHPEAFAEIITQSPKMRSVFQYTEAISPTLLPVLISGETGVGKELIAKVIHRLSRRRGKFVSVNVAGIDDTLFADTLFGHKKGAFTGAVQDRKGLIESAAGGTLFLDEIGDLRFESQVKLLRLLQEGKYFPVGSDIPRISDARIVVATNVCLAQKQQEGNFRKDLFYRLQAHQIIQPPLRERKEDVPLLVRHFLDKATQKLGRTPITPPPELFVLLKNYSFPGNIRELEGMVFDAVSRHKGGVLSMMSFREKIRFSEIEDAGSDLVIPASAVSERIIFPEQTPTLKATEQQLIEAALQRADGNQRIAASFLGITRRALNNRLRRSETE
ncbi:sigma-54-dependent Fis family transcriptional regulator [bacterium]|nr:sigma-54-dependent Fis family transcriptional regulator [bacterium]